MVDIEPSFSLSYGTETESAITIEFQLPPKLAERGKRLVEEQHLDIDTLALEMFLEYLEEQDDIAYAREQLAMIRSGAVPTISLEGMEHRLFGLDR